MGTININKKFEPLFRVFEPEYDHVRYVVMTGGRGSSKSVSVGTFINHCTYQDGFRVLFTRWTMSSAESSIIPEFKEKCEWLQNDGDFHFKSTEVINTKTGTSILYRGIKPASATANSALKSLNGVNIVVFEEAEEIADEMLFDKIDLSVRTKGCKNVIIICMNPCSSEHWIHNRFFDENHNPKCADTLYIHTTYEDNIVNLNSTFIKQAERMKKENYLKYRHVFMGDWLTDVQGALWTNAMIDNYRVTAIPENVVIDRIVVGNDPSGDDGQKKLNPLDRKADEIGIVTVGRGLVNGVYHFYVMHDDSMNGGPNEWARQTIKAHDRVKANYIVAEKNYGGAMVEATIKSACETPDAYKIKLTTSSRSKIIRAEPVASLYDEGRVHHVGHFSQMEFEMRTYTGVGHSPNRYDALVFAVNELMEKKKIARSR